MALKKITPSTESMDMKKRPATEQSPITKHRCLNMQPEQAQRRAERERNRKYRARTEQEKQHAKTRTTPSVATEPTPERQMARKHRPCCGKQHKHCTCRPPSGMQRKQLALLVKRFVRTPLCSVKDTTDVNVWQTLMQPATEQLPLRVLLAYAHTHVVFNQEPLLKAFIHRRAFLFKAPWFN